MKAFLVGLVGLALSGCMSVQAVPVVSGGSKADGVVTVSYDRGALVKPPKDWSHISSQVRKRCAAWGYEGATPFEGEKAQCVAADQSNCGIWEITITYQCVN